MRFKSSEGSTKRAHNTYTV